MLETAPSRAPFSFGECLLDNWLYLSFDSGTPSRILTKIFFAMRQFRPGSRRWNRGRGFLYANHCRLFLRGVIAGHAAARCSLKKPWRINMLSANWKFSYLAFPPVCC
jgi:hypothetical protein